MMTTEEIAEITKICHDRGLADRRPYAKNTKLFETKAGRKRLSITIVPGSQSLFYATNLPLHCFRSSGSRYLANKETAIITITALTTAFERALQRIKKTYKIKG
jgi:hypothetical protein